MGGCEAKISPHTHPKRERGSPDRLNALASFEIKMRGWRIPPSLMVGVYRVNAGGRLLRRLCQRLVAPWAGVEQVMQVRRVESQLQVGRAWPVRAAGTVGRNPC
jgi:hypothetical protein